MALWVRAGIAVAAAGGLAVGAATCISPAPGVPAATRPTTWAAPLVEPGCPNLHRVAPGLYRGAQPDAEGMRSLARLGVKTVVNLRARHEDDDAIGGLALRAERIPINTWDSEDWHVERFLQIATDPARQPLFVHCQHGADRTGMMCAAYRMVVEGWSDAEAIRELTEGGYGWHPMWGNLLDRLRKLDVARLRRELRLPEPPPRR